MPDIRIPPTEATIHGPGSDWLGRGPKTKDGYLWLHAALDLHNKGRAVVAPESGRVVFSVLTIPAGRSPFGGFGPSVVVLQGDSGYYHWLGHVVDPIVKRNQYVQVGDVVAKSAGTKVPHVHWSVRKVNIPYKKDAYWPWTVSVDPYRWLFKSELTGPQAISYTRSHTHNWQSPTERMRVLGRKYPFALTWTTPIQKTIRNKIFLIRRQTTVENIAVGIIGGLAILAVILS